MLDDTLRFAGFLAIVGIATFVLIKLVQRLDKYLNKKSLVKDVIRKAKIEYKERNK